MRGRRLDTFDLRPDRDDPERATEGNIEDEVAGKQDGEDGDAAEKDDLNRLAPGQSQNALGVAFCEDEAELGRVPRFASAEKLARAAVLVQRLGHEHSPAVERSAVGQD